MRQRAAYLCMGVLVVCCGGLVDCTCSGGISDSNPTNICGTGYVRTSRGCVLATELCSPACSADKRCVEGKCVERSPSGGTVGCTRPCEAGFVCDADTGSCVVAGQCPQPCGADSFCVQGQCVLRRSCNPPCPQLGYLCDQGQCKKICTPSCTEGQVCLDGICQKKCEPACGNDAFCLDGSCVKRQDADNDGFTNDRDCDDNDKARSPGVIEVCDGKDNNCDGLIDNIEQKTCYNGASGTLGRGVCVAGLTMCRAGKPICMGQVTPTAELCDQEDNDCNGLIDDRCRKAGGLDETTPESSDASETTTEGENLVER
ncbi:MAG: putative metal-binding motif-containing protein [Myxococcota bacterium]